MEGGGHRSHARIMTLLLALGLGVASASPRSAQAQTPDVGGAWSLEVETDQGVTTPSWVLEQDGTSLTGRYSSEALGENRIRGTVEGSTIVITFSADMQGQSIPVEYRGTLGDDGVIRGSIDIAGGMLQGTFTAVRSGR